MKKLSIKTKIMIWFTVAMLVMVIGTSAVNFFISRQVLNQSIQDRLIDAVSSNALEIEYRSSMSGEREPQDFFLSYNDGLLEIDDDFLDYSEGIYTALVDSDNNLLYGELPVRLDGDKAFSYTTVGTTNTDGEKFYVYEKPLSGENLDGLWLRGFVSERESTNVLYNMVRLSLWLIPVIATVALLGGYAITKRSFLPIEAIDRAAREISASRDLTKRIPTVSQGEDKKGRDEIQNLAKTFNRMFDRLEDAFNAEKQFTSDASHELRTPLSVIKANCEYALKFAQSEEDFKEALHAIERQSDRASALLSQLLFFARLDQKQGEHRFDMIDLSAAVKSVCDDRRLLLPPSIVLEEEISPEISAPADESLILRLLNNLVDNAVKYIGDGDRVTVTLSQSDEEISLTVSDNGPGISPENMDKIWNRFYMADRSRCETCENSFGLGLSMVKEIARIHGGRMEASSVPGEGSRFTFVLPKNF